MRKLIPFLRERDGLVAIEWVAIAAVALVAAVSITLIVSQGTANLGGAVADQMSDAADDVSG